MKLPTFRTLNGLFPFYGAALLIVASATFYTARLWPTAPTLNATPVTTQAIDAPAIADKLDFPLAQAVTKFGFNHAIQLIHSAKSINPELNYSVFAARPGASNTQWMLIDATDSALRAIPANQLVDKAGALNIGDTQLYRQPLKLNNNLVGFLFIEVPEQPPQVGEQENVTKPSVEFYAMAIITLLFISLSIIIFPRLIARTVKAHTTQLESEISEITEKEDYRLSVSTNVGIGLKSIAQHINQLLLRVEKSDSDHKEAAQELKNLQSSLEAQVEARTQELEHATLLAQQASDTKTNFLATMSHEIRTPMNGIIGTIDLLRHTELDGAQHRLTSIIRDSAFSLLGILDDILDFSKIEAGKLKIEKKPFSPGLVVEEVARVMSSIAHKNNLSLSLYISPNVPENLVGDMVRVRQVIYNLCSNAIKFTQTTQEQRGQVSISVDVKEHTHDFYTLEFKVADNGKGMTKQQLAEIFLPFSQAEDSITREYGGTGLGLSICKSLSELMYGSISVTSELGLGSEFTVSLPLEIGESTAISHQGALKKKRVALYCVDGERNEQLNAYLRFLGAEVIQLQDFKQIETLNDEKGLIWLLNGLDQMPMVNKILQRIVGKLDEHKQQVVVLGRLDEAKLNFKHIYYLNAQPLCRSSLFSSLLVAAGLHVPKQIQRVESMNHFPSVNKARDENRLVLLVEDNVLNQQVITDQLHLLGYGVDVAQNGEEGLEMWRKGHYPIILTDLHMPRMSGYDLANEIREEAIEREDLNERPVIIAITANALKGEKEKCLKMGMDDYLTKPVELNTIEQVLAKWTPMVSFKKAPAAPIDETSLSSYVGDDLEKTQHYLNMFLEHGNSLMTKLKKAAKEENVEEIGGLSHQLKSTAKTVGANDLANSAAYLEQTCLSLNYDMKEIEYAHDELEQRYVEAREYINDKLSTLKGAEQA